MELVKLRQKVRYAGSSSHLRFGEVGRLDEDVEKVERDKEYGVVFEDFEKFVFLGRDLKKERDMRDMMSDQAREKYEREETEIEVKLKEKGL